MERKTVGRRTIKRGSARQVVDTSFAIEWKGRYRIEGPAFIYADRNTGRVTTILGYPTQKLAQAG